MQIDFFSVGCNKPYKITKPIRLIELFAGIGSQAKALKKIGANFEHYRICEFDKYAVQSYNAIHGTNFKPTDITKITADDLGITDTDKYEYIMTYSFPCTDLSVAGKQAGMAKGSGTRSGLLWEVERLLRECKDLPQVLLMENVPQVLNADFGSWLSFLESLGYRNYYKRLNAKNFGVPQNRERCFVDKAEVTSDGINTDGICSSCFIDMPKATCLTLEELQAYAKIGTDIKLLHITAPVLYDKPKELNEFYNTKQCKPEYSPFGYQWTWEDRHKRKTGGWKNKYRPVPIECHRCKSLVGGKDYLDEKSGCILFDYECISNYHKPLARPPQSYMRIQAERRN